MTSFLYALFGLSLLASCISLLMYYRLPVSNRSPVPAASPGVILVVGMIAGRFVNGETIRNAIAVVSCGVSVTLIAIDYRHNRRQLRKLKGAI